MTETIETSTALWSLASYAIIAMAYLAGLMFIAGLAWRLWRYLTTPMPWPEVVTPAPTSERGAITRVLTDVLVFPNLFKADRLLWAGAWIFHFTLLVVLFRHLRYITYPVPAPIVTLGSMALLSGSLFGLSVLYLLWRRLVLPRPLYISGLPDYFALLLLGAIAATGLLIRYQVHVYVVDVKAFMLGLLTLQPVPPPRHPLFLVHFLLVLTLLASFPFSKLMHAGGIFFTPTRNQPYDIQNVA